MQIYNQLIDQIQTGKFDDTQKLPSEKELAKQFDVSINTIRKALTNLIVAGYIVSRHGSGYYLSEHNNFNSLQLKSMKDTHTTRNITSKIISFEIVQANEWQALKLNLDVGTVIYEVKRVRYLDGIASLIEHTIVPVQLFPSLKQEIFESSFYHYIEDESEYKIDRAIKDISTILVNEHISNYFDKSIGEPVLVVENYGFLSNGTQFEYSYNIHADQKFSLSISKI